jgi:uncharacterized membrane protein
MQVSKPVAIFGFHFCSTVFIGLSVYGIARYLNEGLLQTDSFLAAASYAAVILGSIAGICFFGREADRRRAEELKKPVPPRSA